MQKSIPFRAALLYPSMTDIAFLMPLVFLFCGNKGAGTLLGDGDTGWHLRTGEWILAHGQVPDRDLFSYTRAGQPWFAWEWLWDVLFGWLHLHAGMAAVVLGSALALALTFALLFRLARSKGNALVALACTLVAAAASAGHWLARPHVFTMLFTVVFYTILERAESGQRSKRRLWVLPPLMILWTNVHGGFLVGILLVAVYAAGHFLKLLREQDAAQRRHSFRSGRRLLYVAATCGLATLANPYFYHLHIHIAKYLADGFYRANIMEFQSLNFQTGQARFFEILLAAGAAAAFRKLSGRSFTWPLLFALWAHLALTSARNVEIFVLLAAVPASEFLTQVLQLTHELASLADFACELNVFDQGPRWHAASAAAVILLLVLTETAHPPSFWSAVYDPHSFPVTAARRLEQANLSGHVFTEDLWGGYLIYRQYPHSSVFIDGRSDFYGPEFVGKYMRALGAQAGWEQYLSGYGVETVLLPPDAPLACALKQSTTWKPIYDDGVAMIFRPSTAGGPLASTPPPNPTPVSN